MDGLGVKMQGKPLRENSGSTRCGWTTMTRLLQTDDNGWYVGKVWGESMSLKRSFQESSRWLSMYGVLLGRSGARCRIALILVMQAMNIFVCAATSSILWAGSHALKVMVQLDVAEIPRKPILKRWTREARDLLPAEFLMYLKEQGQPKSATYKHSKIYKQTLDIVKRGNAIVDSYSMAMNKMQILVRHLRKSTGMVWALNIEKKATTSTDHGIIPMVPAKPAISGDRCSRESGMFSVPSKKRQDWLKGGRPTTSRDKPPYEMHYLPISVVILLKIQGRNPVVKPVG